MTPFALAAVHFGIGLIGTVVIDALVRRMHRIGSHSLSIAPLIMAVASAQAARYLSPWLTPLLLAAYALIAYREQRPPPES
ncbi:MAG TPA: hypothetical protein VN581_08085 [Patescibacteria group bacterium]|nr:hypothetical protein [Patescibacteria group bacterium]